MSSVNLITICQVIGGLGVCIDTCFNIFRIGTITFKGCVVCKYSGVNEVNVLLMSFIYTKNKRESSTEHCGTPALIFLPDDVPFLLLLFVLDQSNNI